MTRLLDGREVSRSLLSELKERVSRLKEAGVFPKLVVILVGKDPASQVYVRNKAKACEKVGILSETVKMDENVSEAELLKKIEELNLDESVSGLIVQVPLPRHINPALVIRAIAPDKDADGFHAYNLGKMFLSPDFERLPPATPKGIVALLDYYDTDYQGKEVVVLGRSNTVGKPVATMLLNRNATVTVCHSRTKDVAAHARRADILIAAVGKKHFVTADMVKEGASIVDVGIHRNEDGSLSGDVDFKALQGKAGAISPVPGGVGPMTVASLLQNTVTAAEHQHKLKLNP